ncbi:MAG TPA: glycosyltransferase, partial [Saprospiraceae bacterium]|nr:glycosyltransferase [Saprospiraceae bacterium]
ILAHHMPWGKDKLTTIHKGHDPGWYQSIPRIERSSMGFNEKDILVCCVANVRPFKGIPFLINATYSLPGEFPIHFLLIGNGYDVGTVKSLIVNSPIKDRIHILGFRKDSLSIVSASDATVLTSTHGEALTKSVIESMCLGIPPIITDIPGNKGLVIDKHSGWVVPPKNSLALSAAILEMASDKDERLQRGINAREHIRQHFNTAQTVKEFLQLYERLK